MLNIFFIAKPKNTLLRAKDVISFISALILSATLAKPAFAEFSTAFFCTLSQDRGKIIVGLTANKKAYAVFHVASKKVIGNGRFEKMSNEKYTFSNGLLDGGVLERAFEHMSGTPTYSLKTKKHGQSSCGKIR